MSYRSKNDYTELMMAGVLIRCEESVKEDAPYWCGYKAKPHEAPKVLEVQGTSHTGESEDRHGRGAKHRRMVSERCSC